MVFKKKQKEELSNILKRNKVDFKIIDLEFNDINGGSFAITVAKKKSKSYFIYGKGEGIY